MFRIVEETTCEGGFGNELKMRGNDSVKLEELNDLMTFGAVEIVEGVLWCAVENGSIEREGIKLVLPGVT
jgi:hypothetical protein